MPLRNVAQPGHPFTGTGVAQIPAMALEDARDDDPALGSRIGKSDVVCRISERHLLAMRGDAFVVLEKIEVEAAGLPELKQHAEATANLSHPNLAKVYGCETGPDGATWWISELVPGASLSELRAACKKAGKSLPVGITFAVIYEAALALG